MHPKYSPQERRQLLIHWEKVTLYSMILKLMRLCVDLRDMLCRNSHPTALLCWPVLCSTHFAIVLC